MDSKKLAWALLVLFLIAGCKQNESKHSTPNVLIIIADDLGWNQLGCYGGPYLTPILDSLASEGMHFTNAYASAAVCSPTRSALMTGKYPARLHLTDFIKGQEFPDSLLSQPDWQKYLPLEERTIGEIFRENGYHTALFGKWHLSPEKRPPASEPFNPDKQGFDEYMVTYKPVKGKTDPGYDPHNVDSITTRAMAFLDHVNDKPFFLVVSHNAIHDPIMEHEDRIAGYQEATLSSTIRVSPVLGAMVGRLDEGCGNLLGKLEELGLDRNTIVVFCSDNGGKESYASQYPLRKGKGWLHEGGIRVPLIIRWPGHIAPGSSSPAIISSMDLLPTLVEMAGLEPIGGETIDGISLAGEVLGREKVKNRTLYWHYPHYHAGTGMKPASALRDGRYKLIEWHEEFLLGAHAWELYDLQSDQGEVHDLSHEQPALLDSLRGELNNWRIEVNAQMPMLR